MVFRDTAVKEIRFASVTPGSNTNLAAVFSQHAVNGEILKVEWQTNTEASIFITVSGTGEIIWSNATPSGLGFQQSHPFVYGVTNADVTGSPSAFMRNNIHAPIAFTGSAFAGGSVTDLILYYR